MLRFTKGLYLNASCINMYFYDLKYFTFCGGCALKMTLFNLIQEMKDFDSLIQSVWFNISKMINC